MNDREVTRRQVLQVATAAFGAAAFGLGCRRSEKTDSTNDASDVTSMPRGPVPTLGWEVIASGKAGPGARSRHGLVYDRGANAAVLFGGVVWDPDWSFPTDTWELHGREWTRIRTSEA